MKHKTISPESLAAVLAALSAAEIAIDLHGKLDNTARECAEIDALALLHAARRAVQSEPETLLCPVEILDHAREWTLGDLHAAEMSGEGKTEIDVDTLRARVDALDRMEKGE